MSNSSSSHEAKRQRLLSDEVAEKAEEAEEAEEEDNIDISTQSQSQSQSQSKPFNSQDTAFTAVVPSSLSADRLPDTEATLPLATATTTTTTMMMMPPRQQQQQQPQPQQLPAAVVNHPIPIPIPTNHHHPHDPRVIIASTLRKLKLNLNNRTSSSIPSSGTVDVVIQALKELRKWADDDTKDHRRLFLNIFWELDGMTQVTKLLEQLLVVKQQQLHLLSSSSSSSSSLSSPYHNLMIDIWDYLKHIARIISHCTHNGMNGKKKQNNQDIASKIAKTFVRNDGLKTLLQIAFLNYIDDDDDDDDDDTDKETTTNETETTATATATAATLTPAVTAATAAAIATATSTPSNNTSVSKNTTDKFRAICYIWGGLMNVASHTIAIQNSTLNQEQTQLVFDCGITTIQLLKKQQQTNKTNENTVATAATAKNDNNKNICDDIPYYKILKNIFGTLANVLNFHNRENIQPPTLLMNDIFHITINDVLKKEKKNHNTKQEVNDDNDNDDDDDDKSEWDYNVEVWKKVSFFFLLCKQRCILRVADTAAAAAVTPPVNGIDKVGDTNNDGRNNDGDETTKVISNDLELVISFCIEYIKHDPNEAYQAGIFSILQQYCLGPDNFDDDDDDEAVVAYDEMYCASQYIRNIPGFIIILGTVLDAKKYNSFGDDDDYSIEQRTKVATKKLLSSILKVD